ncbi:MAG: FAD-binding protein [Pseudomonadota bacterium]
MAPNKTSAFLAALPEHVAVETAEDAIAAAGSDVFSTSSHTPFAVLKPQTVKDVQAIWRAASHIGVALVNRGGGLSYTGGVLPGMAEMAVLDVRGLGDIGPPDLTDQVISAEAGATWQALDGALSGSGWRAALTPPISGSASTVGGALAQGLPTGLEAVIGVDVVTPDGTLHAIGPHHFGQRQTGAHRMMGADLLGLFLGTGGAFGTIVRTHLRLERVPAASAYRSYGVPDLRAAAALMVAMGPHAFGARLFTMPVRRQADLAQLPLADKVKTGLKTLSAANGVSDAAKRMRLLAKTALGPSDTAGHTACVHAIIEGPNQSAAGAAALALDDVAAQHDATPVSAALPAVMQSRPYSLRGMLGPKGERWVPVHGVGPLSRLMAYADIVTDFFDAQQPDLDKHKISTSWLMMAWPGRCALIEPMFLWPAPLLPIHQAAGKVAGRVSQAWDEEAERRTAQVTALKQALTRQLDEAGALHVQLGQTYAYQDRLSPPVAALLGSIKAHLDPHGLAAPGNLGFGP